MSKVTQGLGDLQERADGGETVGNLQLICPLLPQALLATLNCVLSVLS